MSASSAGPQPCHVEVPARSLLALTAAVDDEQQAASGVLPAVENTVV